MGYNPIPEDQWSQDDLDRATAAGDYAAVNAARKSGRLHTILQPAAPELSDAARLQQVLDTPPPPPVGPTVPGQQPGGTAVPHIDQAHLDRLAASGNYAEINRLRREGQLTHLGAPPARHTN